MVVPITLSPTMEDSLQLKVSFVLFYVMPVFSLQIRNRLPHLQRAHPVKIFVKGKV